MSPLSKQSLAYPWIDVTDELPPCPKDINALGTQVLVWPPVKMEGYSDSYTAFYGRRATGKPEFYLHGAPLYNVTHWAHFPDGPRKKTS